MNLLNLSSLISPRIVTPALLLVAGAHTQATPTFWTGPTFTYIHAANSSASDKITTNHVGADSVNNVWLSRGVSHPLYNAAAESAWNGSTSPVNTKWILASGSLTNAPTLTGYDTFDNVVGQPGNSPGRSAGKTFFVHLISDDIYLSLKLTEWGNNDGGSFQYQRSTPAVAPPTPAVTITNPVSGAVFVAPANVGIDASASVNSGTVTNVQFFANANALGSVTAAPFTLTSSPLAAGAYRLSAVATAGGITATSAIVNVSVINPTNVNLSSVNLTGGHFNFNFSADAGLSYVIQSSSNLLHWVSLATNTAASTSIPFSDTFNPNGATYYRIGRLPNP